MSDRFDHTLEHTLKTKLAEPGNGPDDAVAPVRRIELITGTGRRRRWSDDDKARIIVESLGPGSCVSEVARRNGMSPQQLCGPAFAPVIVATSPVVPPAALLPGHIEIVIGDCIVRVLGQVETGLLTTVLRSVRRAS